MIKTKRSIYDSEEEEKKWIVAGGNYFSRNFGWPLRVVGGNLNGQNLNGQMLLKSSEIEFQ